MGDFQGHPFRGNQWTGSVEYRTSAGRANFDKALEHVRKNYAEMLHKDLAHIILQPREAMRRPGHGNATTILGLFHAPAPKVDERGRPVRDARGELVKGTKSGISVRGGTKYAVKDFVRTLVHELTHAKQFYEGRKSDEGEAYEAGARAASKYYFGVENPAKKVSR